LIAVLRCFKQVAYLKRKAVFFFPVEDVGRKLEIVSPKKRWRSGWLMDLRMVYLRLASGPDLEFGVIFKERVWVE